MTAFVSGDIALDIDSANQTQRILFKGTDLKFIVAQLASAPLVGLRVVLWPDTYTLAEKVFNAIDSLTVQGLDPLVKVSRFFTILAYIKAQIGRTVSYIRGPCTKSDPGKTARTKADRSTHSKAKMCG
jgi:hypothetical protein